MLHLVQRKHVNINQIKFLFLLHRLTEHLMLPFENLSPPQEHLRVFKGRVLCLLTNYHFYSHPIASDMFCSGLHACQAT